MRYLIVLPTAILGGAERFLLNLVQLFLKQGAFVKVVIMNKGPEEHWISLDKYEKFTLIARNYKSEKSSLPHLTLDMLKISINYKPNYVISSHSHVNGYLSFLKKIGFFNDSVLISRESTNVFDRYKGRQRIFFKLIYKYLYGEQDLIVCQTKSMEKSLIKNLGFVPGKNIGTFPNPVNIEYIEKRICPNNKKKKYIVACGRFIDIKQFDLLVKAFSKIVEKNPEYTLVILGDGLQKEKISSLIRKLDIVENTILPGRVENPYEWFSVSEIGVISSKLEGFPNVLLEMMASGISKIVTTPCTDSVYNIPNIIVTNDCSEESIRKGIEKSINLNNEYSNFYYNYIKNNRSVKSFWQSVYLVAH